MTALEALYKTKATLEDEPFRFSSWCLCTCGHLFGAAMGRGARRNEEVFRSPVASIPEELGAWKSVVTEVATALGWSGERPDDDAVIFLSDRTVRQARYRLHVATGGIQSVQVSREDALQVINRAIAVIEAKEAEKAKVEVADHEYALS